MSPEENKNNEIDPNMLDSSTDGDGNNSDSPPQASNQEDYEKELKEEQKVKIVNVIKQPSTPLCQYKRSQLKISVNDGWVKKLGLFSFSFISFKVDLEPLGYSVRRKEEDFQYLRKYLCKIYPAHFIPPLVLGSKKQTEEVIKKKERYFTKFLTNVLRDK